MFEWVNYEGAPLYNLQLLQCDILTCLYKYAFMHMLSTIVLNTEYLNNDSVANVKKEIRDHMDKPAD